MKNGYGLRLRLNQRGFTVAELTVAIVILGFFSTLLMYFGFSTWRYASLLEADVSTFVGRLNANDFVRERIGSSSGLINQNSIPDNNTHNQDPDTPSGLYWQPLHAIPKNTPATGSGTSPLLYFKKFSTSSNGVFIMNGLQPFEDEFILYLDLVNKRLMLRTLANPNATGNSLKTSCPESVASASCPADRIIIEDLASVDTKYFSKSGNTIDFTSSTDPITGEYAGPDFPAVEVIEFNFHIAKKPFLQKSNATLSDTVVRIALRNT